MYIIVPITEWLTEVDGKTRVHATDKTGIHNYLLETSNITDLVDLTVGNNHRCNFRYKEHAANRKAVSGWVKANLSKAYIEAVALLPFDSKFISLSLYKNNIYGNPTYDVIIPSASISMAFAHAKESYHASWIIYSKFAFDTVRVLSDLSLDEIVLLATVDMVTTTSTTTTESDWALVTNGDVWYRKGERGGVYVIDFSEDGGTTWELNIVVLFLDETSIIIDIDAGITGYRHEVRGRDYCIDQAITIWGFSGVEGIDWENIYNIDK